MLLFISVASAPTNVSATALSATSILLTWNLPTLVDGRLHDYKVRYKLSSNSTYGGTVTAGNQFHFIVNDLDPFAEYELQVNSCVV